MKLKNKLAAGALCAALAVSLAIPASAHGGRCRRYTTTGTTQTAVAVCPYEDCTLTGRHTHNGTTYCGYNHTNGTCANSYHRAGGHH